jgi:hypothetical protein
MCYAVYTMMMNNGVAGCCLQGKCSHFLLMTQILPLLPGSSNIMYQLAVLSSNDDTRIKKVWPYITTLLWLKRIHH